jgi:hypothetical protein
VGDSYLYGDYVSCRPSKGVRIRIVDFPGKAESGYRYQADVRIGDTCTTAMSMIDETFRTALAQISAHTVIEIEPFD